ncbi:BA75_00160T0 [Komagataella pastoris]|uniref:BA75_00160T0 n=1 Tax=Komagataella pastoris TaxID=4922 RepID=A0A1B2J8X3_PICPA|nr:BA75_00160T0 [Komagataella pastoris]
MWATCPGRIQLELADADELDLEEMRKTVTWGRETKQKMIRYSFQKSSRLSIIKPNIKMDFNYSAWKERVRTRNHVSSKIDHEKPSTLTRLYRKVVRNWKKSTMEEAVSPKIQVPAINCTIFSSSLSEKYMSSDYEYSIPRRGSLRDSEESSLASIVSPGSGIIPLKKDHSVRRQRSQLSRYSYKPADFGAIFDNLPESTDNDSQTFIASPLSDSSPNQDLWNHLPIRPFRTIDDGLEVQESD